MLLFLKPSVVFSHINYFFITNQMLCVTLLHNKTISKPKQAGKSSRFVTGKRKDLPIKQLSMQNF